MPPFRRWADLPSDLVCRIGDCLDIKYYSSSRGVCTAWRHALAPPTPSLLMLHRHEISSCPAAAAAVSLHPTHRAFDLNAIIPPGERCVGSSNGWLALSVGGRQQGMFSLFHTVTAAEVALPPLTYDGEWVSKIVFANNPAADDFVAATICATNRLAYVTAGAKRWAVLDPVDLAGVGDQLTDLVYHENGNKVYCLTRYGDVHVMRLPQRCRREPFVMVDKDSARRPAWRWRSTFKGSRDAALAPPPQRILPHCETLRRRSLGPHLNPPATLEPLSSSDLPFDPATSFAPPYSTITRHTGVKNLVLCQGNLYQIWRNPTCTINVKLPGGGGHRLRVPENQVFVLRYYPRRQPCWGVVTDLGGYSVFVGRNNAVSMYAQGVLGLKGNPRC